MSHQHALLVSFPRGGERGVAEEFTAQIQRKNGCRAVQGAGPVFFKALGWVI